MPTTATSAKKAGPCLVPLRPLSLQDVEVFFQKKLFGTLIGEHKLPYSPYTPGVSESQKSPEARKTSGFTEKLH